MLTEPLVYVVTPVCMFCGEAGSISVPQAGLIAWKSGALIQEALPELSAPEREMLKSGIHSSCWDTMFNDENDDYEEEN